jgi:hypothetical protein
LSNSLSALVSICLTLSNISFSILLKLPLLFNLFINSFIFCSLSLELGELFISFNLSKQISSSDVSLSLSFYLSIILFNALEFKSFFNKAISEFNLSLVFVNFNMIRSFLSAG